MPSAVVSSTDLAEGHPQAEHRRRRAFRALDPIGIPLPGLRSRWGRFRDIGPRNQASGFEGELNFGLGVNKLTPGQKNVLILRGLAWVSAFFLSSIPIR